MSESDEDREVEGMMREVMRVTARVTRPPTSPQTEQSRAVCPGAPEPAVDCLNDDADQAAVAAGGTPGRAAAGDARPKAIAGMRNVPAEMACLTPRQIMAARMLLAGRRLNDVAAHLGVNRHTVSGWLRQQRFQREVRRMAMELPLPDPWRADDFAG